MTQTAKKPAAKKAAAKPKPLDTAKLAALAAEIAARGGQDMTDLEARYVAEEGLVIDEMPEGARIYICKMHDVIASSSESRRMALINWSNAARRAVLKGAA